MLGRGGRRRASSAPGFEELSAGAGTEGPLLVVCGEGLGPPERASLSARLGNDAPSIGVVVVEQLCEQPRALMAALAGRRAGAVVVAGCDSAQATAALREAVSAGLDTARSATISLAPVLLEAICLAGARRASALLGEPLAGRERLQLRGLLDRRALLTPWQEAPRRTAVLDPPRRTAILDPTRCPGASRCGACLAVCPGAALRTDGDSLRVDPFRCTSCGQCVPSCPTGAISLPGAALAGIAAELETLLAEGIAAFTLTCEHSPAVLAPAAKGCPDEPAALVTLPCVAMASPGLLLGLLARRARVELAPCQGCRDDRALGRAVGFVERVLDSLERRDLRERLSGAGASQVRDIAEVVPRRAAHPLGEMAGSLVLREPMATNAALTRLLAGPDDDLRLDETILDDGAPTGIVRIDSAACTFCGACALACPTGAIWLTGEDGELLVDATRCLACGRCATACPEKAVRMTRGVDLQGLRTGPVRLRRPISSSSCARCGARVNEDPILAPVARRLVARGASAALVASLRRCSTCGAPALPSADPGPSRGPVLHAGPTAGR